MSFAARGADGRICALFGASGPGHEEELPGGHPEVAAFLGTPKAGAAFEAIDADFIRVIEDVIDVLIARGLLRLTDLPVDAQRKLLSRKGARTRLREGLRLLGNDDAL